MKKYALGIFTLIVAASLSAAESVPGKVTADRLNLRFAPELKSPVACRVAKDVELQIVAVRGNWVEVAAPEELKVYISEAYVSGGKLIRAVPMHNDKSSRAPSFGELPAGSEVKLLDDRAYGWVRIAPPENIRLFAASMYVDFDASKLPKPADAAASEKKDAEAAPAEKAEAPEKTADAPATGESAPAEPVPLEIPAPAKESK